MLRELTTSTAYSELHPTFRRSSNRIDGCEIKKFKPEVIVQQSVQAFLS